jgi:amino acid adenylation domain-containing protein
MAVFSAFVIGDGVVHLKCLEILVQAGHRIFGIYSTDGSLEPWAEEFDVLHAASRQAFCDRLLNTEYDYLFSINNNWILPREIITRARKATLNYHDSPLPKYAGVYATSWAILHGETQHAVTWHEVVADINAGSIFKQQAVPIQPDDTVLTLNARCFKTAVATFAELVQELEDESVVVFPQDLSLWSYFGRKDRPEAAGILSFNDTSQNLHNLVRSLDFAHTRNSFGSAKLWLSGGVVTVGFAYPPIPNLSGTPGQVISLDTVGLCVATADSAICLNRFATLSGEPLSEEDLREHYGVQPGVVLPRLEATIRHKISQDNATLCVREQTWVKHLLELAPFRHPYLQNERPSNTLADGLYHYPIEFPIDSAKPQTLLGLFAAYCARLSPEVEFDVGLQTQTQRNLNPEIFAQQVPLRVRLQDGEGLNHFQNCFEASLKYTSKLGSYALDIVARYPELRDRSATQTFPVALVLVLCPSEFNWNSLDCAIAFVVYEDGSQPELVHNGALDENRSIAIVQQLQRLIAASLDQPDLPLHLMPLLSEAEQHQILVEWNQTEKPYPRDRCIHELFTEQALRTPDAPAVCFGDIQLSYRELDRRSNQLAHWLYKLEIKPDTLIVLCVPRSLEMIIGLLGILKAGAAYVPVDPTYPAERIAYLLVDSSPQAVVTVGDLRNTLFTEIDNIICLDDHKAILSEFSSDLLKTEVEPENLAYVIYTSGSTGKPKGVQISHSSSIDRSLAMADIYDLKISDRVLQSASISFDLAGEQIYPALFRGATVVVRPDDLMQSFSRFSRFVTSQGITVMILSTAFWHEWTLELLDSGQKLPPKLRILSIGTEKALLPRLKQWDKVTEGRVAFFQGYGPTEATVTSTIYCHKGEALDRYSTLPIGRPIANTKTYILDQHLQPVPIGVPGELYIGGIGLARGYLNQPKLTAEKFISIPSQSPLSTVGGDRLYKTGDLVRYFPDGNIEFFERLDNQVKIRGFRVELGEIEAILAQHSDVKDAVVVVREDIPGDKRLIAYVVPKQAKVFAIDELNHFIKQKLPNYMVPSTYVFLDALPMTNNGKVDCRALPTPNRTIRAKKPVFLIPGGEGDKEEIIKLARLFHFVGRDQPVHGIHSRGLDGKEKPHTQMEAIASDYIQEVRSVQPQGPYFLIGECLGGLAAFEMAQQLRRLGEEVALLTLLDTPLPTSSILQDFRENKKLSTRILENIRHIVHLNPTQLWPFLLNQARKAIGLLYPEISDSVGRSHYARVKIMEALLSYEPQSYDGRATLFVCEDFDEDQILDWGNLVRDLEIHRLPGNHHSYIRDHAPTMAEILKSCINQALTEALPSAMGNVNGHTGFPNQYDQESDATFVFPRDQLERQLMQIFENVLGVSSISIRDDFFDLGGSSLLALQLVSKIEKTFQKNLPTSAVFQSVNIEQLANILRQI